MRSLYALIVLAGTAVAQKSAVDLKHGVTVTALSFSPDGVTLASAGQDQSIRLWDLKTGQARELQGHEGTLTCLAYSRDGKRLVSGSRDGTVIVWDPVAGKLLKRLTGHERSVLSVSLSPDSKVIASASYDQTIRLWDTTSGTMLHEVEAHSDAVSCIHYSPDGRTLATGGHDSAVKVWDVAADSKSLKLRHTLRDGRKGEVTGLGFTMGGRILASVTPYGAIRLRDPIKGEQLRVMMVDDVTTLALACSGDGRIVAGAGLGGAFGLCESATGDPITRMEDPSVRTSYLSFSPLEGYPGEVRALALSSTGLTAAVGTKNGMILVRQIDRLLLRDRIPSSLSEKELHELWGQMRDRSASKGYHAIALMAVRPEVSIPFLKQQIRVVAPPEPHHVAKLIEQLEHPRFAQREQAASELEANLEAVEGELRKRLKPGCSLELRKRIERLLQPLDEQVPPPDRLRVARALVVLERVASPAALQVLESLSRGSPDAWLTREARQALERLRRTVP